MPEKSIQDMVDLLNKGMLEVDTMGYVRLTQEGMDQLVKLLKNLETPQEAKKNPFAIFNASFSEEEDSSSMKFEGNEKTVLLFFTIPRSFLGKTADRLHVVKVLASEEVLLFTQAFSMEEMRDGCSMVAEVEYLPGGEVLKKILASKDLVTTDCRVALAIMDGGSFDLDGMVNDSVTDPAFVIEAEEKESPSPEPSGGASGGGNGGCSVGFVPLATLLLALPLVLLKR